MHYFIIRGPLSVNLGVEISNLRDRLQYIKEQTVELKESLHVRFLVKWCLYNWNSILTHSSFFFDLFQPHCQRAFTNSFLPYLPLEICRKIILQIFSKHTVVITNVPGPEKQVFIANKPVSTCRFTANSLFSVISILSYNGQITITLNIDDHAIPNAHLLPKFFLNALVDLGKEFNVDIPHTLQNCISWESYNS